MKCKHTFKDFRFLYHNTCPDLAICQKCNKKILVEFKIGKSIKESLKNKENNLKKILSSKNKFKQISNKLNK